MLRNVGEIFTYSFPSAEKSSALSTVIVGILASAERMTVHAGFEGKMLHASTLIGNIEISVGLRYPASWQSFRKA